MKTKAITVLLMLVSIFSYSQEKVKVRGIITDIFSNKVSGAKVVIVNSSRSTVSDFDGTFFIYAKKGEVLRITAHERYGRDVMIGVFTDTIIDGKRYMNIRLHNKGNGRR